MAADPEDRAGDGPRKADFLGAFHDLERVVDTHLFVICANNSGSTFLQKALATSRRTWNLPWEGRKAGGYVGPRPARPASDPGLAVVEDDDDAGESGMVGQERAEHDHGARHEPRRRWQAVRAA